MTKPLIGITLDHETNETYARYPWYALRENYTAAVVNGGGIPVLLPHFTDLIDDYAGILHGLLIPGGCHDIDPALYGSSDIDGTVYTKPGRTSFEMAIARRFYDDDKPILGICGGLQVLNVMTGGTLVYHIPDAYPGGLPHEQTAPKHLTTHDIRLEKGTLLHTIMGNDTFAVNSTHHQAIDRPGMGGVINCHALDDVVEGIEFPDKRFCLGVQWHPEYETTPFDRHLFQAFIAACTKKDIE